MESFVVFSINYSTPLLFEFLVVSKNPWPLPRSSSAQMVTIVGPSTLWPIHWGLSWAGITSQHRPDVVPKVSRYFSAGAFFFMLYVDAWPHQMTLMHQTRPTAVMNTLSY